MERFVDLDFICKCGHANFAHLAPLRVKFRNTWNAFICRTLIAAKNDSTMKRAYCACDKFQRDNLKYLEMLSKEKEVADL